MAPEQCDADRFPGRIGPQADVWGLGATLHHALSGHRPFPRPKGAGDSDDPLLRFPQLHSRPEPLPAHLPRQLVSLIESMLAPDPHGRPSAAEVAAGLEPIVARAATQADPVAWGAGVVTAARPHKRSAVAHWSVMETCTERAS